VLCHRGVRLGNREIGISSKEFDNEEVGFKNININSK
jgi:hypothetical protein